MSAVSIFTLLAGIGFVAAAVLLVIMAIRQAPQESASLVIAERARQIQHERWSADHDDEHDLGQLGAAAACYALPQHLRSVHQSRCHGQSLVGAIWPFCGSSWKPTPDDRIRELTKAGALILAELDRELRARDRGDRAGGAS